LPALQRVFRTPRYDSRGRGLSEKFSGMADISNLVADIAAVIEGAVRRVQADASMHRSYLDGGDVFAGIACGRVKSAVHRNTNSL
jgi:hypothetical protein